MHSEAQRPRISVAVVLAAAEHVTGTPAHVLTCRAQFEPAVTHRRCAQVAARRLGVRVAHIGRRMYLSRHAVRRDTVARLCETHGETIAAIEARALELAADPGAAITLPAAGGPVPDMAVLLRAASEVTGSAVADIVHHGRLEPFQSHYLCAVAAARRVGIDPGTTARALGRAPATVHGRPGRLERVESVHGATVSAIAARAREIARTPGEARGPVLTAVPPSRFRRGSDAHYNGAGA